MKATGAFSHAQNLGLRSIPEFVRKSLDKKILDKLIEDRHGLSFKDRIGCQLRVIRKGKNLGRFYSYSEYGGVENTVKTAMIDCQEIRNISPREYSGKDYVHWKERYDRRKGMVEYQYQVYFTLHGKQKMKVFSMGYKRPSVSKQLHAFRTARLFRHFFELYGDDFEEHLSWFAPWKEIRLYYPERSYFPWKEA